MLIENHKRIIEEGFRAIEWAVDQGIEKNQVTIGFHASNIAVNLLELHLHNLKLIKLDNMLKHDWFASKNKIEEKLNFNFEKKEPILKLLFIIEEKRNILCYGKQQSTDTINNVLEKLYELKNIISSLEVKNENN